MSTHMLRDALALVDEDELERRLLDEPAASVGTVVESRCVGDIKTL